MREGKRTLNLVNPSYSVQEECKEPEVFLKPCSEVGGKMAVVRLPDGGLRLA